MLLLAFKGNGDVKGKSESLAEKFNVVGFAIFWSLSSELAFSLCHYAGLEDFSGCILLSNDN